MFKHLGKYKREYTFNINESDSKKRNAPRNGREVYLVVLQ